MSTDIESRVMEMRFDNAQFESGVKTSLSTIDRLKQALNFEKTGQGLTQLPKNLALDGLEKSVGIISKRFTTLGVIGTTVLQNITNSAMRMGSKLAHAISGPIIEGGISRAANISQAKFQIEGLGQAWEGISEIVNEVVTDTAYGFDEAAKAAAMLGASGMEAGKEMETALKGIAGTAAMTNSSFSEIADIFTTVASNGKLMAYQMNQLSFRGMNASAVLAKALGKSEADIHEMVSKGQIDFETFAKAMNDAFGEHTKDANKTFEGSLANMKAALARIGQAFIEPAREHLIPVFNAVKDKIKEVRAALDVGGEKDSFLAHVIQLMGKISKWVTGFVKKINLNWLADGLKVIENIFIGVHGIVMRLRDQLLKLLPKDLAKKFSDIGKAIKDWSEQFRKNNAYKAMDKMAKAAEKVKKPLYDVEKLARRVINGDFGNGQKRVKELHAIDVSYAKVQNRVNEILGCSVRHKESQEDLAAEERRRNKLLKKQGKALKDVSKETKKVADANKKTETVYSKLAKTIGGIIAVFKIIVNAVSAFYRVIAKPLLPKLLSLILTMTSKIGEKLMDLSAYVEKTNMFERFFTNVKTSASGVVTVVGNIFRGFKKLTSVQSIFGKITSGIPKLFTAIRNLPNAVSKLVSKMQKMEGFSKLFDTLSELGNKLKDFFIKRFEDAGEALGKLGDKGKNLASSGGLLEFFDMLAGKLADFIRFLMDGADKIPGVFTAIKEKIIPVIDLLKKGGEHAGNFLGNLGGTAKDKIGGIKDALDGLSDKMGIVQTSSGKLTDGMEGIFSSLSDGSQNIYKYAKDAGGNLVKGLADGFKGVSLDKALGWAKALAGLVLTYNLVKMVQTIKSTFESLSGVLDSVASVPKKLAGVFGALSSAIENYEKNMKAEVVYTLSKSLVLIASSLLILSGIPTEKLANIAADMALVIFAVAALMRAIGLMPVKEVTAAESASEAIKDVGANLAGAIKNFGNVLAAALGRGLRLIGIAAVIISVAASMKLLAETFMEVAKFKMDPNEAKQAAIAMGALATGLVTSAILMGKFAGALGMGTAATVLSFAASMIILAKAIKAIGAIDTSDFEQGLTGVLALMVPMAALMMLSQYSKGIISFSAGLVILSVALTLLIVPLKLLSRGNYDQALTNLAKLVLGMSLFSIVAPKLKKGTGAALAFAAALVVMAAAFRIFAPAADAAVVMVGVLAGIMVILASSAAVLEVFSAGAAMLIGVLLSLGAAFISFGAGAALFGVAVKLFGEGLILIGQGFVSLATGFITSLAMITANRDTITQGIIDLITSVSHALIVSAPALTIAAAGMIMALAIGIAKATPSIMAALGTLAISILDFIGQFFITAAVVAVQVIVRFINTLASAIVQNAGPLMDAISNLNLALLYVLVEGLASLATALARMVDAMFGTDLTGTVTGWFDKIKSGIQAGMADGDTYKQQGKEFTSGIVNGMHEGLTEGTPLIGEDFANLMSKLEEFYNDPLLQNSPFAHAHEGWGVSINNLTGDIDTYGNTLGAGLGKIKGIAKTGAEDLGGSVPDGFTNILDGDTSAIDSISDWSDNVINEAEGKFETHSPSRVFMEIGANIVAGLVQGLKQNAKSLSGPIAEIAKKLSGAFSGGSGSGSKAGASMMKGLTSSLKSGGSSAAASMSGIVKGMTGALTKGASAFTAAGKDVVQRLKQGLENKRQSAVSAMTSVMAAIKRASSGHSLYSVGQSLSEGLKSGIWSKVSSIASAAASLVARAIAAAKARAKTNSPSKEFMWIGESFGEGMVKGVNNFTGKVTASSADMAGAAIAKAKSTLSNLSDMLDLNAQPVITPVVDLNNVYATARDIDALFGSGSIGVNANLGAITRMMNAHQNGSQNSDVVDAISKLRQDINKIEGTTNVINGVTYDDGSNIVSAVETIVRAATIEGRA